MAKNTRTARAALILPAVHHPRREPADPASIRADGRPRTTPSRAQIDADGRFSATRRESRSPLRWPPTIFPGMRTPGLHARERGRSNGVTAVGQRRFHNVRPPAKRSQGGRAIRLPGSPIVARACPGRAWAEHGRADRHSGLCSWRAGHRRRADQTEMPRCGGTLCRRRRSRVDLSAPPPYKPPPNLGCSGDRAASNIDARVPHQCRGRRAREAIRSGRLNLNAERHP